MQINRKTNVHLLVSLVAVSIIALAGCRTGGFTKPDLSGLAFWKKGGDKLAANSVPPPPARHFDPAPLDGASKGETEVVNLDGRNLRGRFENNMEQALADIDAAASGIDKPIRSPIRKPYSTEIKSNGNEFNPNGSAAKPGNVRSKLAGFGNSVAESTGKNLSLAQQEFQAAMSKVNPASDKGVAAKSDSSNDFNTGWKNDIKLPTGIAKASNSVDQSLASVNQSLNNANRRLTEGVANAANSFKTKTNDFKNNIQPNIGAVAESTNQFAGKAQNKLASSTQPLSNFATNNSFSPKGLTPNNPPPSTGTDRSQELVRVQSQVAEAKQQIERLKMQVEEAKRKSTSSAATANSMILDAAKAPERVAQIQKPAFSSAYANPGSLTGKPANVLRSPNGALTPSDTRPLATPGQSGSSTPTYPSTPHGGFAPIGATTTPKSNFAPSSQTGNMQASFQSSTNKSNVVPAGTTSKSADSTSRIPNFVHDVDIPESVLKGTGSYAPGSVNALKK